MIIGQLNINIMTQIDQKTKDNIDLLVISHMTLKVLSGEEIDVNSYYFKYYMNILIFKIGITNISNAKIILPKEFYRYINGYDVKYDLLHNEGIDIISIEPNILKKMLSNIKRYYFKGCELNFPMSTKYDYGSYFDATKEIFNKTFESIVRSVDCVDNSIKLKFLEKDLADSIKVENYELCAKIKKQIDKLK